MKIYFSGSIAGGREKAQDYAKIANELEKYGQILDKHVVNPLFSTKNETLSPKQIYTRDVSWIQECDMVIAEVSIPSLGVGYELAYAERFHKKVICIYDKTKNLSAMIRGNENFQKIPYESMEELLEKLKEILEN